MDWQQLIKEEFAKDYYKRLLAFIKEDSQLYAIYPNRDDAFNALKGCSLSQVKIVILGMDPYIGLNQAHGLAFSVNKDCAIPPSLRNIYKEINSDFNKEHKFEHGNLEGWAKQGVLLLNTTLTVRHGESGSHQGKGWEVFTDRIISEINNQDRPIVYLLWGAAARAKAKMITNLKHLKLQAPHPSPLSNYKGFDGCKHFSQSNQFLINNNIEPIDWFDH